MLRQEFRFLSIMLMPCQQTTKQKLFWDWLNLYLEENPTSTYRPGAVWRRGPAITKGRVFPHSEITTRVLKSGVMDNSRSGRIPVAGLAGVETPRPVRIEQRDRGLSRREWESVYPEAVAMLETSGLGQRHLELSSAMGPALGPKELATGKADDSAPGLPERGGKQAAWST